MALRSPGGVLYFLFQDQVGSAIYTTGAYTNKLGSRGYYAFGATRFSEGTMPTDCHFYNGASFLSHTTGDTCPLAQCVINGKMGTIEIMPDVVAWMNCFDKGCQR